MTVEERLFGCCSMRERRKCSTEKGFDNYGCRTDYHCDKLDFVFNATQDAKKRLDDNRSKR